MLFDMDNLPFVNFDAQKVHMDLLFNKNLHWHNCIWKMALVRNYSEPVFLFAVKRLPVFVSMSSSFLW